MQRAHLRLGQWLLIAALLSATGAQWLALQSIAWGAMLVDYARGASLPVAIEKTFDGAHPCRLCQSIEQGKKQEKKSTAVIVAKVDFFHQPHAHLVVRTGTLRAIAVADSRAAPRFEQPPEPPPRSCVG